jgi:hypothetical protein
MATKRSAADEQKDVNAKSIKVEEVIEISESESDNDDEEIIYISSETEDDESANYMLRYYADGDREREVANRRAQDAFLPFYVLVIENLPTDVDFA